MAIIQVIFWTAIAIAMLVLVPLALIKTSIDRFGGRGSERRGSGGISAGVGAAMQELDRIVSRPSVEHTIETEQPTLKREDDSGSD